ncbi:beta strand repeat-containing protein, partial [Moheibacter sediminis]
MKQNNLLKLSLMILLMFFAVATSWGQTNPAAQSLPYSQNFSSLSGTTYPAGWQGWTISGNMSTTIPTAAPNGDKALSAGTNATNSGVVMNMSGKMGVMSTNSNQNAIVLAINTTGQSSINVSYVAATQRQESSARIGAIGLQYRIGTSGDFTNVDGTIYRNPGGSNNTSGTASISPATISITLPAAANNKPIVQLRWAIGDSSGSGNRPSFSIDDISVSVLSLPCATPTGSIVEDIVEAVVPNTATFAVNNATNYTSVQWQLSTNQGGTWSNINGANQISYTTGATTIAMDGYMYRAVLTNASSNCTTTTHQTNPAYLFVNISDEPTISVGSVPAFSTTTGQTDTESITISGINLEGDITLVLSDNTHFDISHDSFPETGGNVNSTLTITYSPLTAGNHSATITLSSPNAVDLILNLNGTASLGVPVATEATDVSYNNFTANWDAVLGAESYEIDVYTIQGNAPVPVNVVGWNFTDNNVTADYGIAGNLNKTISTNSSGTINWLSGSGNSNPPAISNSGWDGGSGSKYWQVNFTTIGISNMKLSSVQRSSNTGPGNFKVQYSLNGSSWFDVAGGAVTVDNDFTTGKLTNVSLPSACENQSLVYLRWIMTNNIQADGEGNVASSGTSAIDDILVTGEQGGTSVVYILQDENVGNITSYEVTDLDPETIYSYVVRALAGAATTTNSNEITVETTAIPAGAIWENGEWLAGIEPDIDRDVTINGDFYISDYDSFEAKTLTVNGSLLIETDYTITVNGLITNNAGPSNFIVENGANLIQLTDGSNIGEITVIRNSKPMKRLDYTLWSSPVIGQNLFGFSPDTVNGITNYPGSTGRIYIYDGVVDTYINPNPFTADAVMNEAVGYLFRAPNNYHATNEVVYQGTFTGTPFNGGLTVPVYAGGYTSVGNPYPSNIDSELFMSANGSVSTLYFWN